MILTKEIVETMTFETNRHGCQEQDEDLKPIDIMEMWAHIGLLISREVHKSADEPVEDL